MYVDRVKYLGDPAFVEIPLERLTLAPATSRTWRAPSTRRRPPRAPALLPALEGSHRLHAEEPHATWTTQSGPQPEQKNTTHISVIDTEGNAVALTTTVNYAFGSCLVAKGTGVLLNDEMDDFAARCPACPTPTGW